MALNSRGIMTSETHIRIARLRAIFRLRTRFCPPPWADIHWLTNVNSMPVGKVHLLASATDHNGRCVFSCPDQGWTGLCGLVGDDGFCRCISDFCPHGARQ